MSTILNKDESCKQNVGWKKARHERVHNIWLHLNEIQKHVKLFHGVRS